MVVRRYWHYLPRLRHRRHRSMSYRASRRLGFFFCYHLSVLFVIPFGVLQATINQQFGLNVLAEIFSGYVLPGHPFALMVFQIVGGYTSLQAVTYSSDLKFGHYMKSETMTN